MISLMIVAGSSSQSLATFLEQRGTFQADFVYNDLHSNAEELCNQIIKVDKLVYVYRIDDKTGNAETNIKNDMQTLRMLLQSGGFFNPAEILFLCGGGKQYTQAKRYFTTIMEECGVSNSAVRTIDKAASFSSVYDNLIGVTLTKDFNNTYRPLYRKERGSESVVGYNPKNDKDLRLEPFSYDNLKNWEDQKRLANSIEQAVPITDPDDIQLSKWMNPDFSGVESEDILQDGKLTIVTGAKRSGKSVWTAALASTAIAAGRRVCVWDLTKAQDLEELCELQGIELQSIEPTLAINLQKSNNDSLCSIYNPKILVEVLGRILHQRFKVFNSVLVVVEEEDFREAYNVLGSVASEVLYTVFPREHDVDSAVKQLKGVKCNKIIPLAKIDVTLQNDAAQVTAEDVKARVAGASVIKQFSFKNCNSPAWLYPRLVLGGGESA